MDELNALLSALPGYDLISDTAKLAALKASRIPDSEGRWPATAGYVETFDVYFAALSLVSFLQALPVVTSAGSEGTSVSATAPDWDALRLHFRSLSPIILATGNSVLQVVPIPNPPHVRKVSMRDRGGYYGDVDSDIG